jgi:WD40 repeat protein
MVFDSKGDGVRDIQFNSQNTNEFIAALDNGTIQRWDFRNPGQCEKKWTAHNGPTLSITWHSDGRYFASGGRDRMIKVWDSKSESRRPISNIYCLEPVGQVEWNPQADFSIASCALSQDSRMYVWDLTKPYTPTQVIDIHHNSVASFAWVDANNLVSCSKDAESGILIKHSILAGYRPMDLFNTCAFSWNANDQIGISIGSFGKDFKRHKSIEKEVHSN